MNVLLVTLDTTRADYLGTYGGPEPTPGFDSVAEAGTRFDLAISTASVTPVSHASILTGLGNHEHGVRVITGEGGYRLPSDVPTLATVLRTEGYRTAAIHSAFPVSSYFGFERGFDEFDDLLAEFEDVGDGEHVSWDVGSFQRRSDDTSNRVIAFLESAGPEPFFLWVHYWDPHDPRLKPPGIERQGPMLYGAEVVYMDSQFARVLDTLRANGQSDDTIVAIVSDHGQGLSDHDWPGHRILYQEQIRVPLLLSVPGHEQVGSVSDLVRTTDIFPTILDYVGLDAPRPVSGASLRALMEGRDDAPRLAFADQINLFDQNAKMVQERPKDDFLYCAMDRRWKLIYRPRHVELSELYDLENDPAESRNLFAERRDEAVRLLKVLADESPWVTVPPPPIESDEADRELAMAAFDGLGYVEGTDSIETDIEWEWVCPDADHAGATAAPGACAECASPRIPRAD